MKYFLTLSVLLGAFAAQAQTLKTDPIGDIHYQGLRSTCFGMTTDIVKTEIKTLCESGNQSCRHSVSITLSESFKSNYGYREYYFWVDADPEKEIGYQPYNPSDVAWPDLFADYRFFFSVNANHNRYYDFPILKVQNCSTVDCAQDSGMESYADLDLQIWDNKITFEWPSDMIPSLGNSRHWKVGFTTYQESKDGSCSGEDDAPQWGNKAYDYRR